jgi:hypothetical protein
MKIFEKVIELIQKFISKTKDSPDFIETLCNAALKNVIMFLTLPQNENLLDDDDYIFIDDLFHCEKHSKQFLKYLSNILIMKIHHDSTIKQLFQNYCDLLEDGKRVDTNELCYNTNQIRQHISKVEQREDLEEDVKRSSPTVDQNEKDIENFIGFLNDEYFDELFNKMQNAQELNIQMNSLVNEIDSKIDSSSDLKKLTEKLKKLVLKQKEVFKDNWIINEAEDESC